jgi:hypothetical protein
MCLTLSLIINFGSLGVCLVAPADLIAFCFLLFGVFSILGFISFV